MYFWRINDGKIIAETQRGPLQSNQTTPASMSRNENFVKRLVGVARSPKFLAFQVQLLITAISTQIFSENTTILLALH